MNLLKYIWNELVIFLTGKDPAMVDAGVCDYSGQGRDKYGR